MDVLHRLKPSQLTLILRIAETGQLQRAAQMAGMSQPAASRMLNEIEQRAGGALFDRYPKGMLATPLGEIVSRRAQVILEEYDALEREARRITTGEMGQVRVGAVTGPAVGLIVPAVRRVKAAAPDIEMTIEVGPSTELVRGLVEGRFDFVISRLPAEHDSRDFRLYPARSEIVSLLVRPAHPLAGRTEVTLEELQGYEWVVQEIGSPIRQAVERAFHEQGLGGPQRITNSSSLLVVLSLLEGTDTIAPQAMEVAQMLTMGQTALGITSLNLAEPISVPPCFIIRNRFRPLPAASERVLQAVLELL
ncbi:LysR family transcriptional regulator [Sagittula sp. MA-2]|jgi:DNA-binding transcriptional LysR family regulator|uniref:LysR family transcriptional regulator n=1 Tax=Sagittula sp. MA-2 TaxID=3048007 RepID=UPI0024C434E0|nr:LysR family transcriptional regulator [Sagittula sp. MA-2]WHZ33336.1 LysR family transcriptional regulator [Sagittula sp. MA-2]